MCDRERIGIKESNNMCKQKQLGKRRGKQYFLKYSSAIIEEAQDTRMVIVID